VIAWGVNRRKRTQVERVVLPVVLAVTAIGGAFAAASSVAACHAGHAPAIDAGPRDGMPDTPLV